MAAPIALLPGMVPPDFQAAITRVTNAALSLDDLNTVALMQEVVGMLAELNPVYTTGSGSVPPPPPPATAVWTFDPALRFLLGSAAVPPPTLELTFDPALRFLVSQ
jgi:hypothetical protein